MQASMVGRFVPGRLAGAGQRYSVVAYEVHSKALMDNPLGDPANRSLLVLLPPGYDPERPAPCPHLWMLPAFGGTGRTLLNFSPTGEDLRERLDRLYEGRQIGDLVVVLPDTFTRLGGNQHIDSVGVGRYEAYLWDELLPFVESQYPATGRAVAGKSSGGYGALMNAMRHPGLFDAVACHSGDMAFELCYLPDAGNLLREVEKAGGLAAFRRKVLEVGLRGRPPRLTPAFRSAMNLYAMACTYSPNPQAEGGVDLPVDLYTGELRPNVWQRWLAHDPVQLVGSVGVRVGAGVGAGAGTDVAAGANVAAPADLEGVPHAAGPIAAALRRLKLLFFDCGDRDEFNLTFGARQLHQRLEAAGVPHVYETFDDGHFDISYRFDRSLPLIWQALSSGHTPAVKQTNRPG